MECLPLGPHLPSLGVNNTCYSCTLFSSFVRAHIWNWQIPDCYVLTVWKAWLMPRMPRMSWGPTPPSHCWSGRWPLSIYRTAVLSQSFHWPYFLCSCACFEKLEFRSIIRHDCWLNLCLLQVPWVSSCCNAAVIEIHSMLWHQGVGWGSSQNKKWCRLLMKSLATLIQWSHFKLKPFIIKLYCT